MTYKVIGKPQVQSEYSDQWETTMVIDLQREDGETGDVWIVAGVPDSRRGSSEAARTQYGYQEVRVFGDTPDSWCPASFDYTDAAEIVAACEAAAFATHRSEREKRAEASA